MLGDLDYVKEKMGEDCWGWSDYSPLLERIGKIAVRVDEDEYQGESFVLFDRGGGRYAVLIFGWGSCSGCDALQACESLEGIVNLLDELRQATIEFESADELFKWLDLREESGSHYFNAAEYKQFEVKATQWVQEHGPAVPW